LRVLLGKLHATKKRLSGVRPPLASRIPGRFARHAVQALKRKNARPIGGDEPFGRGRRPTVIGRFIQTRRTVMSRKFILSLAAVATLASTALVSGSADAMVARGGRTGGHPPIIHIGHPHFHDHVYLWHLREHYVRPVGYVQPVAEGTCNCLTKDYTPDGTVVFKDLCTKETASAPVDGAPEKASEIPAPTNFAGKTYRDYLANK
jgi:hypothetical protein